MNIPNQPKGIAFEVFKKDKETNFQTNS